MSKIVRISLQNFKSISDLQMDFKGLTAIVTGKNNSGKTSFLKGIIDRIRFIRPDVMVKQGEKEGRGELLLDSGEKFIWNFDTEGTDKLTYITNEGRKSVTKELGSQFFPPVFDIDKFLQSSPKQQVAQLQKIVGIDFTKIDKEYEEAYNIRTERNREAEIYHAKLEKMMKVDRVESVNIDSLKAKKKLESDRLNALYLENKAANQKTRLAWEAEKEEIDNQCNAHNNSQKLASDIYDECSVAMNTLIRYGFKGDNGFLKSIFDRIQPPMEAIKHYPPEPTYVDEMPDRTALDLIDAQLLEAANTNAQAEKWMEYQDYKAEVEAAKQKAEDAHFVVVSIEDERKRMVESAKFPEGIEITTDGILVDGFPLDKNQISTSKLYTAALRIASMNLGEVRTLYFDCSYLDRKNLIEICEWAEQQDLQLMLEKPDFDGGEIKYELIES